MLPLSSHHPKCDNVICFHLLQHITTQFYCVTFCYFTLHSNIQRLIIYVACLQTPIYAHTSSIKCCTHNIMLLVFCHVVSQIKRCNCKPSVTLKHLSIINVLWGEHKKLFRYRQCEMCTRTQRDRCVSLHTHIIVKYHIQIVLPTPGQNHISVATCLYSQISTVFLCVYNILFTCCHKHTVFMCSVYRISLDRLIISLYRYSNSQFNCLSAFIHSRFSSLIMSSTSVEFSKIKIFSAYLPPSFSTLH
jgi:hypothetical protein